jgi:hypothetical protein
MNTVYLVLGLGVVLLVIYLIVRYTFGTVAKTETSSILVPIPNSNKQSVLLSESTPVATAEQLDKSWYGTSGSTLFFFINPTIKDRTARVGNEYATAITFGNGVLKLNILVAPDASRGEESAPAQLVIKTNTGSEVVELYNIDLQRWTSVAIVKQSARFKIYLNGKLTAAYTCTTGMPEKDTTQPLKIGDSTGRLDGSITNMVLYSVPLSTQDIFSLISQQAGTDGKPYSVSSDAIGIDSLFSTVPWLGIGCPGGLCTEPKKPNPYETWQTSYA